MSEGWIKLHRSITDWEWFADADTLKLFLYLLLTANYEEKKWKGITIQRGQVVISTEDLAQRLKSTRQKIRTQLKRLETSGTIALQATNKFTLVTICNYDNYQESSTAEQPTDNQQSNQQITSEITNILTNKIYSQVAHFEDNITSSTYDSNQQNNLQNVLNLTSDLTTTKEYKNKEYIATTTAREAEAIEEESEEDEAGEYGEDVRSEEPPQTNLRGDFSANNGEVDKLTASGRERAKNRLRIGDSESTYIGQGEVATIRNWWNLEVANERIRKVNAVTGSRKTLLAQRVKEWTLYAYDNGIAQPTMSWQATLAKIAPIIRDSPYLQGETPRAQPLTFDRLINNDTFWLKILEGQYTDVAPTTTSTTSTTTTNNGRNYTTAGETTRRTDLSDGKRDYSVESLQRFLNR